VIFKSKSEPPALAGGLASNQEKPPANAGGSDLARQNTQFQEEIDYESTEKISYFARNNNFYLDAVFSAVSTDKRECGVLRQFGLRETKGDFAPIGKNATGQKSYQKTAIQSNKNGLR
jgi:hypothetical protein